MNNTTKEEPAQEEHVADPEGGDLPEVSVAEFFRRIYQVTYSKTIGLIIILIVAVYVLLGVLITQASKAVWNDPASREQFLSQMQDRFGGWATVLNFLGLFHIFSSLGFLIVMGALTISIIGCTTHRIPQLWQRFKHPRVNVSDRFYTAARYRGSVETDGDDIQAIRAAKDKFKAARFRVIEADSKSLYVDKYSWGGVGTVIAHLSFIVIIAALVISSVWGFEAVVNVPAGSGTQINVGRQDELTLEATDFSASFTDEGRPLDYVSHLVLRRGGTVVAEQDVRVNEPLRSDGYSFHQSTYGNAVEVTITSMGKVVFTGSLPQQWTATWNSGSVVVGSVELPELGLIIDVLSPASGTQHPSLAPGQVAFIIMDNTTGTIMAAPTVDQGTSEKVGDMELAFDREGQYTGITVRQDPGSTWMWIGSCLLVIGLMVTFMCRHKRIWVRAQNGKLLMASADKQDSGFRREFDELLSQAETWFTPVRSKK